MLSRLQNFHQSKKVINITHAGIRQESYYPSSPITLPTSEPAIAQISFTLTDTDFPSSPDGVLGQMCKFLFWGVIGGRNLDATTVNINFKILKNGTSVGTGLRGLTTNIYYTLAPYFIDCASGDVITIKLWSVSSTNVQNTYAAFFIQPTRFGSNLKVGQLVTDVLLTKSFVAGNYAPTLGFNPSLAVNSNPYFDIGETIGVNVITAGNSVTKVVPTTVYGFARLNNGDVNAIGHNVSATLMPYVTAVNYPVTQVSYRPTSIVL